LVTGRDLSLTSLLGVLMLIGIVVTNAIVMLEFVERLKREEGLSTYDALLEGAAIRLRPILMTALVTIFALMPLALGLSEGALLSSSLATVVIGGLFSSTLLTLLVIPCVYSLIDGLKSRVSSLTASAPEHAPN
jgi:multidrug efflux pump subunit AcrB